jgi:DNA-binding response OmpR family regulator
MNAVSVTNTPGHRIQHRIFLAEDDPALRRLLSDGLTEAGYQVFAARDGRDLMRLISEASRHHVPMPDLFVLDARMPLLGGLDVLSALRSAGWSQPTVVITAFPDPQLHETAVAKGASVILDKPLDLDDLRTVVDLLLITQPSRAENDLG